MNDWNNSENINRIKQLQKGTTQMKKKLIALLTVLALTAFAGCESKDAETTTTTASEATTTTVTEAETTTTTEAETTTAAETETDKKLFKGTGYTLSIDSEKWLDYTEYLDYIAEVTEDTDVAKYGDISAEDVKNVADAIYYNTSNDSNFNVTVVELGTQMNDAALNELSGMLEEQYNAIPGYSCGKCETVYVNGYRALKAVITSDASVTGGAMKVEMYLFYPGTKQVCLTYTAAAADFDSTVADFEEVLNTISF